ncbi:MAG TPA: hypothetical protein VM260_06930 [Pirellula sp.]|nr:hypothetical protein [Pirellula sp.]
MTAKRILFLVGDFVEDYESAGGTYVEPSDDFDSAHTDGNLVTAPAWPAHPAWIAQFSKLLGSKIEA